MRGRSHSQPLSHTQAGAALYSSNDFTLQVLKSYDAKGNAITSFIIVPIKDLKAFLSSEEVDLAQYGTLYTIMGHEVTENVKKDIEDMYRRLIIPPDSLEQSFYIAICNDNLEEAKAIVQSNHDLLPVIDKGRVSPLHLAARNGCLAIISWLINEYGFNIAAVDEYGSNSLHEAASKCQLKAMELLKQHDFGENDIFLVKNNEGLTPIKLLTGFGADKAKLFIDSYQIKLVKRVELCTSILITNLAAHLAPIFNLNLEANNLIFSRVIPIVLGYYLSNDNLSQWVLASYLEKAQTVYRNIDNFRDELPGSAMGTQLSAIRSSPGMQFDEGSPFSLTPQSPSRALNATLGYASSEMGSPVSSLLPPFDMSRQSSISESNSSRRSSTTMSNASSRVSSTTNSPYTAYIGSPALSSALDTLTLTKKPSHSPQKRPGTWVEGAHRSMRTKADSDKDSDKVYDPNSLPPLVLSQNSDDFSR